MSATYFGGFRRAWNYAYGLQAEVAPLRVDIGNSVTGSTSVTLAFAPIKTPDGIVINQPISTTTPITIGSGSNAETVTPSGVSYTGGPNFYDGCTVTATFANTHGTGDLVVSGTAGLQEAINSISATGGSVVVDDGWSIGGGTNAMLAAATLPASGSVAILDNRAGSGSTQFVSTITIANAAVKTLYSVGTTLLPAPGAGNAWVIDEMYVENVYLTAAFAAGGAIQASYGTGVTTPATATIAATFLTSPTANEIIAVAGALASSLSSNVLNKAITLAAASADFTTGGGSLIVKLRYRLLTGF